MFVLLVLIDKSVSMYLKETLSVWIHVLSLCESFKYFENMFLPKYLCMK